MAKAKTEPPTVEDILRGTPHALTIFKPGAVDDLELFAKRGKPYLTCYATGKERPARPEEIVRQLFLKMLMDDYGYLPRYVENGNIAAMQLRSGMKHDRAGLAGNRGRVAR